MNGHIAARLTRSVIDIVARAKRDPSSSIVPRYLSRQQKSENALLSKEVILMRNYDDDDREHVFCEVRRFLDECEARRATQRPPPRRIAWRNCPKWDGRIINLAQVGGGPPVA